jgi:hypothetical protein
MYKDDYPRLFSKYPFKNFDIIIETLLNEFPFLFDLDALERAVGHEANFAYQEFFNACMQGLNADLSQAYLSNEVIRTLYQLVDNDPLKTMMENHHLIVHGKPGDEVKQIGFREKLITGSLNQPSPLSFIDMFRAARWYERAHSSAAAFPCGVAKLNHIKALNLADKKVWLLDLKKEATSPMWAVLNLQDPDHPVLYCEAPLTETQKFTLEHALGKPLEYEGGGAAHSLSSGYAALAWMQEIKRCCALVYKSDFPAMLEEFLFISTRNESKWKCSDGDKTKLSNVYMHLYTPPTARANHGFYGAARACIFTDDDLCGGLVDVVLGAGKTNAACATHTNGHSFVLGLDAALKDLGILREIRDASGETVELIVPESIDYPALNAAYGSHCSAYLVLSNWLNSYVHRSPSVASSIPSQVDIASSMVLSVFRGSAKKPKLRILLPHAFELTPDEENLIVHSMESNAFVTELENIGDNPSIGRVRDRLLAIFARNRLLAMHDYKPPMKDDYWMKAANYYLLYLGLHPDVSLPKETHVEFKKCVMEMGPRGLEDILKLLSDGSYVDQLISNYQGTQPAFYAAYLRHQSGEYLGKLIAHLRDRSPFPYDRLVLTYWSRTDDDIVHLFREVNQLKDHKGVPRFESITLTQGLTVDNLHPFTIFLTRLITLAEADTSYVSFIVIPELSDPDLLDPAYNDVKSSYKLLNDLIIRNRRLVIGQNKLREISEKSNFFTAGMAPSHVGGVGAGAGAGGSSGGMVDDVDGQSLVPVEPFTDRIQHYDFSWERGGETQLQLQQQMQIEQQRQVQQRRQVRQTRVLDEALTGELVDYDNVDRLLAANLSRFQSENPGSDLAGAAALNYGSESLLKSLFHTWVNANPTTKAPRIITKMTQAAAQVLLEKHRFLSSGLNPDNLPRGFYTQRSKDGDLVLCFSPEMGYVGDPNPLTLRLNEELASLEAWEGSFRQFDFPRYMMSGPQLEIEDIQNMALFAVLQPENFDASREYQLFLDKNRSILSSALLSTMEEGDRPQKIIQYWPQFKQMWESNGAAGISRFLAVDPAEFQVRPEHFITVLYKGQPDDLTAWASHNFGHDVSYWKAMGQVYYHFGPQGITTLLRKFQQIQQTLGDEFWTGFYRDVLAKAPHYNLFMRLEFFTAMDEMQEKLKTKPGFLSAWYKVASLHMASSVQWESIDALWGSFAYFLKEIGAMGLELTGREFDNIRPENMRVCLDRLLISLKAIPQDDEKKRFLQTMQDMDITQGGVHYALQEGFKYFDGHLALQDFAAGQPTYAPPLKDLYDWVGQSTAGLYLQRVLASQARFSHATYTELSKPENLGNASQQAMDQLLWILHSHYGDRPILDVLQQMKDANPAYIGFIAKKLHTSVYQQGRASLVVSFDAILALGPVIDRNPAAMANIAQGMDAYPDGSFLEAVSLLHQAQRFSDADLLALGDLVSKNTPRPATCSDDLYQNALKLVTLFGVHESKLHDFYRVTAGMLPVVQRELKVLFAHLLSLDFAHLDNCLAALTNSAVWQALMRCLEDMKRHPEDPSAARFALIDYLTSPDIGLIFKYSKRGEFRALQEADKPILNAFPDHEDRLWSFFRQHIAVPAQGPSPAEALEPIIKVLEALQRSRTYLNEIEPLLASFAGMPSDTYWSSSYFAGLLMALQPADEKVSFPMTLLKVLLKDPVIQAKSMDLVQKEFPEGLTRSLQSILNGNIDNRHEQALLCQIALRNYEESNASETLDEVMSTLGAEHYKTSRQHVLEILVKEPNMGAMRDRLERCIWLKQLTSADAVIRDNWSDTSSLWLKTMSTETKAEELFVAIRTLAAEKQAVLLHIMAWSSLDRALQNKEAYKANLDNKASKLLRRLQVLPLDSLQVLASYYPRRPAPSADELLRLTKGEVDSAILTTRLDAFVCNPYPTARNDYGSMTLTREADLQRMLAETQISAGQRKHLDVQPMADLSLIFAYLKKLQEGQVFEAVVTKPIAEMSQEELRVAFQDLSLRSQRSTDPLERAALWAVLFEVLGRTTYKYPHLAQQFALIANDVCVKAPTRVLQLATGEGKSLFVALRAARNVGLGKSVDVCTAKRVLAERDLEEFQKLFDALGIRTASVHPKSSREDYLKAQVRYTTMGDLSLFFDEQAYQGRAISIAEAERENRVGLFDEFDFMYFQEGAKTEYNYATPTGKSPKQMVWFYQAVNNFYQGLPQDPEHFPKKIDAALVHAFKQALEAAAEQHEDKMTYVQQLAGDPLLLVQWLQSAHIAHRLKKNEQFTVREEQIEIGEEFYPMLEVIPLSSDNQKMMGSTYSAGVHQLLAVRLNSEAKTRQEPQNYHIHPESHVISSQVAAQRFRKLWGAQEGFTGTVSSTQARKLYKEYKAEVLHVPTNQRDLRVWAEPEFFTPEVDESDDAVKGRCYDAIATQIKLCLAEKKSILFACKDDRQVDEVQEQLGRRIPGLLQHFIFYTNEDPRTAETVLHEKQDKERRVGGKNQQGIALVASGFGRGDNVEVQAVFIMGDVADDNDLRQKGGRTARNGEPGTVFQYYLSQDLERETDALLTSLSKQLSSRDVKKLKKIVGHSDEPSLRYRDKQKLFDGLMLLREYEFNLRNAAKEAYNRTLAQFSSWGMSILGQIDDPVARFQFIRGFSARVKEIEKSWVNTSSHSKEGVPEKIAAMRERITNVAAEFKRTYSSSIALVNDADEFACEDTVDSASMQVAQSGKLASDLRHRAVSSICHALALLADLDTNDEIKKIPQWLATVAGQGDMEDDEEDEAHSTDEGSSADDDDDVSEQLSSLADEEGSTKKLDRQKRMSTQALLGLAEACEGKTTAQLLDLFSKARANVLNPVDTWLESEDVSTKKTLDELLDFVIADAEVRAKWQEFTLRLIPRLQTPLVKQLANDSVYPLATRIEKILPLVSYLSHFSVEQQRAWGEKYIAETEYFFSAMPSHWMDRLPPMAFDHCSVLSRIAKAYGDENKEIVVLLERLAHKKTSLESSIRVLSQWAVWLNNLSGDRKKRSCEFFVHLLKLLQSFEEGENWDSLQKLLTKTQAWWVKAGQNKYQEKLLAVWEQLRQHQAVLPELMPFIQWCFEQRGKAWFELLNISMSMDGEVLLRHQEQLKALWTSYPATMKKSAKLAQFKCDIDAMNFIYGQMRSLGAEQQTAVAAKLISYSPDSLTNALGFIQRYSAVCGQYPVLVFAIIQAQGVRLERLTGLCDFIHQLEGVMPGALSNLSATDFADWMGLTPTAFSTVNELLLRNPAFYKQDHARFVQLLSDMKRGTLPNNLSVWQQHLSTASGPRLEALLSKDQLGKILALPPAKCDALLFHLAQNHAEFERYPQCLDELLRHAAKPRVSMTDLPVLSQILIKIVQYHARNQHYKIADLFGQLDPLVDGHFFVLNEVSTAFDDFLIEHPRAFEALFRYAAYLRSGSTPDLKPQQFLLIKVFQYHELNPMRDISDLYSAVGNVCLRAPELLKDLVTLSETMLIQQKELHLLAYPKCFDELLKYALVARGNPNQLELLQKLLIHLAQHHALYGKKGCDDLFTALNTAYSRQPGLLNELLAALNAAFQRQQVLQLSSYSECIDVLLRYAAEPGLASGDLQNVQGLLCNVAEYHRMLPTRDIDALFDALSRVYRNNRGILNGLLRESNTLLANQRHLDLLSHPECFDELLRYAAKPGMQTATLQVLSPLLIKIAQYQKQNPGRALGDLFALLDGIQTRNSALLTGVSEVLDTLFVEQRLSHPECFEELLRYAAKPGMQTATLRVLSSLLIKIAQYQKQNPGRALGDLFATLGRIHSRHPDLLVGVSEALDALFVDQQLSHPECFEFEELLRYAEKPGMQPANLRVLSSLLIKIVQYQKQNPQRALGDLFALLEEIQTRNLALLTPVSGALDTLFVRQQPNGLASYPQCIEELLYYAKQPRFNAAFPLLLELLLKIEQYQKQHPERDCADLFLNLRSFSHDPQLLQELLRAVNVADTAVLPCVLADQMVKIIPRMEHHFVPHRDEFNHISRLFYEGLRRGLTPEGIIAEPKIKVLFDFHSKRRDDQHLQRVLFMKLLHTGAFITAAHQEPRWSKDNNDRLLALALEHYVEKTKVILAVDKPAQSTTVRDLSAQQQRVLLQLSSELSLLDQPTRAGRGKVDNLEAELLQMLGQYQQSWFKSKERKQQSSALQQSISTLFSAGHTARYDSVLASLHAAKEAAMQSDNQLNRQRGLKLNRSGHSRLLETINRMADLVVRHWSTDAEALLSLQVYGRQNQEALRKTTEALILALSTHRQHAYPQCGGRIVGGFFERNARAKHDALWDLEQNLQTFCTTPDLANVKIVEQALQRHLKTSPGEVKTLMNDVLASLPAFSAYLQDRSEEHRLADVGIMLAEV